MSFKEITMDELQFHPFKRIGSDWMLITAGDEKKFNTMTASWGGVGVLWNKNVATCYIRPQRYTKEFVDEKGVFTLSFFGPEHKDALALCGRVSGRDCDKVAEAGLTPFFTDGTAAFEEADLVFICKTLYKAPIRPEDFLWDEIDGKFYPEKDYHDMYIAEIVKILKAE